jgi:Tol biopolymer transport system component
MSESRHARRYRPRRGARTVAALTAALATSAALGTAAAQTCPTELVSVASTGAQGSDDSRDATISSDGRLVAFESLADDLVPGDVAGVLDVFVRDTATGQTLHVSVDSAGNAGNWHSDEPSISADGRYVAFTSHADNLVPGDTNGWSDVFVRDLLLGQTSRVSLGSTGAEGNFHSYDASISADGRYVAFTSLSSTLVPGDTNFQDDVFVHDRLTASTTRVSVSSGGAQGNMDSSHPAISADGRYVAFESYASSLVQQDTNAHSDIFVHDRLAGTTERVSVGPGGSQADGASYTSSISADGRCVAFQSLATDLAPGDTNGSVDVFVHDGVTSSTERVSIATGGGQASGQSYLPSISADGLCVAFASNAGDLVSGDTNDAFDVFVHDRATGETTRVSVDSAGGQASAASTAPAIAGDDRSVAFESLAADLVPGDANGERDVFVHRYDCTVGTPYCFGDGSGAICPCGNWGAMGEGCANSSGSGALLETLGSPGVAADDLVFDASQLVPGQPALLFVGVNAINGGAGTQFGDGLRCAGGSVVRLGVTIPDSNGQAAWGPGLGATGGWSAGDVRYFQVWYRDPSPPGPCGSGFNLTNGVEVSFGA